MIVDTLKRAGLFLVGIWAGCLGGAPGKPLADRACHTDTGGGNLHPRLPATSNQAWQVNDSWGDEPLPAGLRSPALRKPRQRFPADPHAQGLMDRKAGDVPQAFRGSTVS